MKSALRSFPAFRACTGGVVTLEFAMVMMILAPLLVCTLELSRWSTARQHMEDYAVTVAYDVASAPSTIPGATLQELMERIGLLAPELVDTTRTAWSATSADYLAVTISMFLMTPTVATCQYNCTYVANLAWTFGNNKRSCTLKPSIPGAPQAGPVVVVDVVSKYKFVFGVGDRIGPEPTFSVTQWQPVRNWRSATSAYPQLGGSNGDSYGGWTGTKCPGYS